MLDIEVPGEARLEFVEDVRAMSVIEARRLGRCLNHHMCREGRRAERDSPDLQVVDIADVNGIKKMDLDVIKGLPLSGAAASSTRPEVVSHPHAALHI